MNARMQEAAPMVPHSLESEQTLLGILLDNAKTFDRIADVLVTADFFAHEHQLIFGAMARMYGEGKSWDVVVVFEMLGSPANGTPGGLMYLTQLITTSPGPANAVRHASIVRERSRKRALLLIADTMQTEVLSATGSSVEDIVAVADIEMQVVLDRNAKDVHDLDASMDEVFSYIEARQEAANQDATIQIGIAAIDREIGGIEAGQLIVVGGRAGMGKTVLGVHVADRAVAQAKSCLYFTLEMSRREIAARILAKRSAVSTIEMRTISADVFPWKQLLEARSAIQGHRLYIDDRAAIGLSYLRAVSRRHQRQHGLDLIVVDHLGLMQGSGENRVQQIGSVSRGLKAIAKELQVPIVALAQLNRGVEGRADKRPMLSDLRESGDIEQDADVVLMLHRESVYSSEPQWRGIAEILIRKNRHGAACEVIVDFNAEFGIISERFGPNPRSAGTVTKARSRGLA